MEEPSGRRELDRLTSASIFVGVLSALFLVPFGVFLAAPLLHPNAPYARLSQGHWLLGIGVSVGAVVLIIVPLLVLAYKGRLKLAGGILVLTVLWSALCVPYAQLMSMRARCGAQMLMDGVALRGIGQQLIDRVNNGDSLPDSIVPLVLQDGTVQQRLFTNCCSNILADDVVVGQFTLGEILAGRVSDSELKAVLEQQAHDRGVAWESVGPIWFCLDERVYRDRDASIVAAFGVVTYLEDSRYLQVMFADGHIETVSARHSREDKWLLFDRLSAQELREDVPPPPSGWREVLKDFLPAEGVEKVR